MADTASCSTCGAVLPVPVRFCPFCGTATAAAAPVDPPPRPIAEAAVVPPAAPRAPLVPPVSRPPAPPPMPPPAPEPFHASDRGSFPQRRPAPAPRARSRAATRVPGRSVRAVAAARLLAACVILLCGAVVWFHLTGAPSATLVVRVSRPVEGSVTVDGVESGSPGQPIAVAPGRHEIGFAAEGWTTGPVAVRLDANESRTLTLLPVARRAGLSVDSDPAGALLTVDGRRAGRAPLRLRLTPGHHRIAGSLPDRLPDAQAIDLAPGEQRELVLGLHPVPVRTIRIEAPAGQWSAPVALPSGSRFVLQFPGRIRVRAGGHVVLLEGGAPVDLGSLDPSDLSVEAVGDAALPVDLVLHAPD